jgi:hypothetical protein
MAFQPGRTSYLSVDGTDVTAFSDTETLNRNVDTIDTTVFGLADRTFIAGLGGNDLSQGGPWDPTGDAVFHGCFDGASVATVFGPEGNTSGDVQYTNATSFITNYTISSSVDGRVDSSAAFTGSGAPSRGTV